MTAAQDVSIGPMCASVAHIPAIPFHGVFANPEDPFGVNRTQEGELRSPSAFAGLLQSMSLSSWFLVHARLSISIRLPGPKKLLRSFGDEIVRGLKDNAYHTLGLQGVWPDWHRSIKDAIKSPQYRVGCGFVVRGTVERANI